MRLAWRTLRLSLVVASSVALFGCVEPYDGSWVEFSLGAGTHIPADVGNVGNGQPPGDTHYEYWVETGGNAFKVAEFLVSKQFDSQFPCFIEIGRGVQFPGLHSTQFYNKVLAVAVEDDPMPSMEEIDRLADAQKRMENQVNVERQLKAVVSYDPNVTPAVLDQLAQEIVANNAGADLIDDEANARRLEVCQRFFDAHPDYYVGNDKVFSLPITGHWYGMVEGADPRNNAPVGGAGFTVPFTFKQFDYFWMTWQFNSAHYNDDGSLDTTQSVDPRILNNVTRTIDGQTVSQGPYGPSFTGYHYMSGKPQMRTRRTINVDLQNQQFTGVNGKMAIFPGIDEDEAVF
jgi:hypothetical protein